MFSTAGQTPWYIVHKWHQHIYLVHDLESFKRWLTQTDLSCAVEHDYCTVGTLNSCAVVTGKPDSAGRQEVSLATPQQPRSLLYNLPFPPSCLHLLTTMYNTYTDTHNNCTHMWRAITYLTILYIILTYKEKNTLDNNH